MDSGAELYRQFLDGDKEALVEIVREYKDGLILYLNSIVKDICVAEELAEDTFVKLVVKQPMFAAHSSFKTWLFAIGHHTAVDYIRKSAKGVQISIDELYDYSDEETIEREYIQEEQRRQLHRALGRLHADYSQVLYLTYFEGFSNTDTAKVMHKSNRQIENLVFRAKKALKTELEKEGFVYEGL